MALNFRGALYRITQDADGETKITFTVPRSDLMAMSIVGHWTEQQLLIRVFVNAKQMSFDAMLENDDEYAAE